MQANPILSANKMFFHCQANGNNTVTRNATVKDKIGIGLGHHLAGDLEIRVECCHVDRRAVPFYNSAVVKSGEFGLFVFLDGDRVDEDWNDRKAFVFPELFIVVAPEAVWR